MKAPFGLAQWGVIAALHDSGLRAEAADLSAARAPADVLRQSLTLLDSARVTGEARYAVTCLVSMVRPHVEAADAQTAVQS